MATSLGPSFSYRIFHERDGLVGMQMQRSASDPGAASHELGCVW
jgi:hypothetical protein